MKEKGDVFDRSQQLGLKMLSFVTKKVKALIKRGKRIKLANAFHRFEVTLRKNYNRGKLMSEPRVRK